MGQTYCAHPSVVRRLLHVAGPRPRLSMSMPLRSPHICQEIMKTRGFVRASYPEGGQERSNSQLIDEACRSGSSLGKSFDARNA